MAECVWINPWKDSGDRGAARCDHDRECHPDHNHVWADSTYEWEQVGQMHIAPGDGLVATPRTVTAQRCQICHLATRDVHECRP